VLVPVTRTGSGIGVRIVDIASPDAIAIGELVPIVPRRKGPLLIGAATAGCAGDARTGAPLEGERLKKINPEAAAHGKSSTVAGSEFGISPEQDALGAGPDAKVYIVGAVLLEEVAIAVAHKTATAIAELKESAVLVGSVGFLEFTDRGRLIRKT
jgi:hypothetical protein